MLNAWFRSRKTIEDKTPANKNDVGACVHDANVNIEETVLDQVLSDKTLAELERQQQVRLEDLVSNLLRDQMHILEHVVQQATNTDPIPNLLNTTGLQDLLIEGGLVRPDEAVQRRRRAINQFLNGIHHAGSSDALDQ